MMAYIVVDLNIREERMLHLQQKTPRLLLGVR